ncbi:alpha/beta fold hydrolase [Pseudorhodoplanes sp.]|uniref:alpha/beta fold hydrolase n=1 Tax=Pseudorhodoplanes sp. TaxID=1934341 RepID=UPI003918C050
MPTVDVSGGRIAYDVAGQGEPVLFISGLGGMAAFWAAQVAAFSPSFRVLSFDHRGVGRSEGAQPYSVAQWSNDVLALLDHANANRAHVVGHSTGGIIAQVFAVTHPERVRTLTLGGTWLAPDRRFRDQFALRKQVLAEIGGDAYRMLGDLLASPLPQTATHAAQEMKAWERDVIAARIDALLAYDGAAIAPRIAARTLVLAADDDYIVPLHHSKAVAAAIPGARLKRYHGGGHFFPKTRAGDYNKTLSEFWAETDR